MGHFIEFVRFGKNDSCIEMDLGVLKMVQISQIFNARLSELAGNPDLR